MFIYAKHYTFFYVFIIMDHMHIIAHLNRSAIHKIHLLLKKIK